MGFMPFSMGISLRLNVIARLEVELTYYDVTVHHTSHYDNDTSLWIIDT